ncbi:MAG: hypothetical protein AB1Z98_13880 [Nannocystaceae bacterium]
MYGRLHGLRRRRAPAVTWSVAAALVLAAPGCSVILDPERYDDLPRCRFDDDCPAAEDPRYELVCTVAEAYEDQELDFPRICSPRPSVSCNPREYDFYSELATRYREATSLRARYGDTCLDLPGVQGCSPGDEGCQPGLSPHELSRRCDDGDLQTPPAVAVVPEVAGQDVLDQFCRSIYCDVRYACETNDFRCVACELGKPLGAGGCADLYFAGVRSTVYQDGDALQEQCAGPDVDPEDAYIGPVGGEDIDISE